MIFPFVFCAFAQEIDWSINHRHLEEGLDVYVHVVPDVGFLSFSVQYQLDGAEESGLPHFVEHLMFEHRHGGRSYDQWLENMGGVSRAQTDLSSLRLYANIPSEGWDRLLYLEKSRMESLCDSLRQEDIENQYSIIQQESFESEYSKDILYGQLLRRASFGERGLGRSVLGDVSSSSMWNRDQVCSYVSDNLLRKPIKIFVVGDVETEKVIADIQKNFGGHTRKNMKEPVSSFSYDVVQVRQEGRASRLYALWPIPKQDYEDIPALKRWRYILGHPRIGLLNQQRVQTRGWIEFGVDGGYFLLRLSGDTNDALEMYLRKKITKIESLLFFWWQRDLQIQVQKIQNRSKIHALQRIEGRLSLMEDCVSMNRIKECFSSLFLSQTIPQSDLQDAQKRWLSWENVSLLRVEER